MNVDAIRDAIPYYLTRERAEGFLKELKNYSENTRLITDNQDEQFLQGDGWRGFSAYNFEQSRAHSLRGIILSNSCDISPENKREIPAKVTFAPIVKLSAIEELFKSVLKASAATDKVAAIRRQENTSFFYIPNQGLLDEDYVAWLGDVHSMPILPFLSDENTKRERLFSLTMVGFYIFVIKLSIHFCRFHEKVDRPF